MRRESGQPVKRFEVVEVLPAMLTSAMLLAALYTSGTGQAAGQHQPTDGHAPVQITVTPLR